MLQVELTNRLTSALNLLEPDAAPKQQVGYSFKVENDH